MKSTLRGCWVCELNSGLLALYEAIKDWFIWLSKTKYSMMFWLCRAIWESAETDEHQPAVWPSGRASYQLPEGVVVSAGQRHAVPWRLPRTFALAGCHRHFSCTTFRLYQQQQWGKSKGPRTTGKSNHRDWLLWLDKNKSMIGMLVSLLFAFGLFTTAFRLYYCVLQNHTVPSDAYNADVHQCICVTELVLSVNPCIFN